LEEWRLPVSVVSLAAGHANPATTMRLYVDAAGDALDLALAAPEPWVKQLAPAEK
jgi:hypothetical protein